MTRSLPGTNATLMDIPSTSLLMERLRTSWACFFTGKQAFQDLHEVIFKGPFRGTTLQLQVVSLRFITSDVAVCEVLEWVSGFKNGPPPGLRLDTKGRLQTRLLQVMAKRSGDWEIVVYHNVDIKPDVQAPEPK